MDGYKFPVGIRHMETVLWFTAGFRKHKPYMDHRWGHVSIWIPLRGNHNQIFLHMDHKYFIFSSLCAQSETVIYGYLQIFIH